MAKVFVGLFLGVSLLGGVYLLRPAPAPPENNLTPSSGAYIDFRPSMVVLDTHPWFSEIQFTLNLVNDSDQTARIATVSTSCGCTVIDSAGLMGAVVPANARIEIAGVVELDGSLGAHVRDVQVMLDSGAIRTAHIKYQVYGRYSVTPSSLDCGEIDIDSEEEHVLKARFASPEGVLVDSLAADSRWLNVGLVSGDGDTVIAAGVRKSYLTVGRNLATITVLTTDEFRPTFSIPVEAIGFAEFHTVPTHIFGRPGDIATVIVLDLSGNRLRVKAANSTNPAFTAKLVSHDQVAVSIGTAGGAMEGATIILTLEDGRTAKTLASIVN